MITSILKYDKWLQIFEEKKRDEPKLKINLDGSKRVVFEANERIYPIDE